MDQANAIKEVAKIADQFLLEDGTYDENLVLILTSENSFVCAIYIVFCVKNLLEPIGTMGLDCGWKLIRVISRSTFTLQHSMMRWLV
jgi:hypothetical protein